MVELKIGKYYGIEFKWHPLKILILFWVSTRITCGESVDLKFMRIPSWQAVAAIHNKVRAGCVAGSVASKVKECTL